MSASALQVTTPTPLDPFERRDEWRFALLLLALVAAQGGQATADASGTRTSSPGPGRGPTAAARRTSNRRRTARLVRPPRSC